MKINDKQIIQILLDGNYIPKDVVPDAEKYAKHEGASIIDYLLTQGILNKDLLGQAIAEFYGIPYADINSNTPTRETVLKIPEEIAKKYNVVLFSVDKEKVVFATDSPAKPGILEELQSYFVDKDDEIAQKEFALAYCLEEDIKPLFVHYRKPLQTRFSEISADAKLTAASDLIDDIVDDALAYKSSDIHFEPQKKDVIIRFRIDGILSEAGRISKAIYENILNRIKVLAKLRIDEHSAAQDGAIRYEREGKSVDLRVSVVPIYDGEKIAIRILSTYIQGFGLNDIGLGPVHQDILTKASMKPFGMILVTGPTGSGKTTTLYSILKSLNSPERNITTIEDPVEYKIAGVNQIQVNSLTNLTFAKGLRSIVRQDPDVILVGEIRDEETAEISVNAALTGHLLLSTFHANDAATAIPRLIDMNIEPFLLSSTLEVIIAQRLVRTICEKCRYSYEVNIDDLKRDYPQAAFYFSGKKTNLYKGKGCDKCNHTGYSGRTALFEFIVGSRTLRDLILLNPSAQQVWDAAKKQGSISMFEDGMTKVKNGLTTIEEVLRVANPEEMSLYAPKKSRIKNK
ncbi:Flp pilus assembly complex ATPase component TadA [Candidatus Dojkabacteria bacterium]|nr:Flp pilus assembly complex ATPase component TadA [Candidatus Dojkabacteria bacterium]